jgi:hypothetical protein
MFHQFDEPVVDGESMIFRVSSGRFLPSSFPLCYVYVDPDRRIRAASLQPAGKGASHVMPSVRRPSFW